MGGGKWKHTVVRFFNHSKFVQYYVKVDCDNLGVFGKP